MARTLKSDKTLFLVTLLLVGAGLVMVYSASAFMATDKHQNPYHFLTRQAMFAVIGLVGMLVAMRTDYHEYRRPAVIWSMLSICTVLLLWVFSFYPVNGAQRWIYIAGMSVQPSEIAKLAAVIFAAAVLERRMHRVNEIRYALLPIGGMCLVFLGLILQEPDLGTSAVIVLAVTGMVFAAGLHYRYLFATLSLLLAGAVALVYAQPYRMDRISTFLDPWTDPRGYQIRQSMLAIGSGGWFGKGLMQGIQKVYYLPEPHTDFIYSVVGEEFGLVGTTLMLGCFVLVAWRGLRVSLLSPDRFGSLLALGITLSIVMQALVNISVVTAIVPNKGIPLPFVSNGGSSLVLSMVAMGVLLNISQHASVSASAVAPGRPRWTLGEQEA